jgi:hypothetical protein
MERDSDEAAREQALRDELPEDLRKAKIVYSVSCNCFELVKNEATVDYVMSTVLALTLLALWGYSAYWVFTAEEVTALMWVTFWLTVGSLLMLLVITLNKSSAVHKIEYKRYRNQAPDWYSLD